MRLTFLPLLAALIVSCDPAPEAPPSDLGGATGGAATGGANAVATDGATHTASGGVHSTASGGTSSDGGESTGGDGASSDGSGGHEPNGHGSGGGAGDGPTGLSWPIDCIPEETCVNLDPPDIDSDGIAYDCGEPGYQGHEGTDIGITWDAMEEGVLVRAAADGEVFFASDGKFDHCPDDTEPDCTNPPSYEAGANSGTTVCTDLGPYCGTGTDSCFWCFAGGNVIVILHEGIPGVFATRYDHLKKGSVLVSPGDHVTRGQPIAMVGSAGNSTGPHLHFEVWGTGYYELAEPWAGACGPNFGPSLWQSEPPWE